MFTPRKVAIMMMAAICLAGCSNGGDSASIPESVNEAGKKKADNRYQLSSFASGNFSIKEAMNRYLDAKAIAKKKVTYRDLIKAADTAMDQMDFESGIVLATEAINLNPKGPEGYFMRGRGIYNSPHGSSDDALKDLLKASRLGQKDGRSYEYTARIYNDRKKPKKAIAALTKAIEKNPRERDYYKYRATIYGELNKFNKAEADYIKHVEVAPGKLGGYLDRALFYQKIGKRRKAIDDLNSIIKMTDGQANSDKRINAFRLRAVILSELGKHEESIADLNVLLKLEKNSGEVYTLRAKEWEALKKVHKAIDDYTKAIENSPEFAAGNAYKGRSELYEKLGEVELSKSDLKKYEEIQSMPAEKQIFELKR